MGLVKLTVSKPQTVAKGKTYLDLNEGRSIVSNIKMTEIVFKLKMTPENNFKRDTISVKTAKISFGTHVRLLPLIKFHRIFDIS